MNPQGALIGFGEVRHRRLRPVGNAFSYPTYFLMLPMRHLRAHGSDTLALNRPGLLSFHERDHGDGRSAQSGGALAWLDALLQEAGIQDATGEAWLQTYPRVLGHTFKPVSFWYCHTPHGDLRAVVAEVNNTFGERHCDSGEHIIARVDHDDADGPLIETSLSGTLQPVTPTSLRRALLRYPALTLGVVARIHWQALRLWLKRVPFRHKPAPPAEWVSRQTP